MRLLPSDPDIDTLVSRIGSGDIDLQPDFQRGEVWSETKKQRLIDSILRDWHVPPVHVIELLETARQEVLDGQQRLAAIRDFVAGKVRIDGTIQPYSSEIAALDGLTYDELSPAWRRRFGQFTIRVFKIVDYSTGEPYELFYRLNQPANLTAAEQRNAFYGPAREQIKVLSARFEEFGIDKSYIGFSNSRMAYDDVLARLCVSLEHQSISVKITAAALADRYRDGAPFSDRTVQQCEAAISGLASAKPYAELKPRFNKATLFSWLWFLSDLQSSGATLAQPDRFGRFLTFFEQQRIGQHGPGIRFGGDVTKIETVVAAFMPTYNDRSSARVADVSSVLARDFVIWLVALLYSALTEKVSELTPKKIGLITEALEKHRSGGLAGPDAIVDVISQSPEWGRHL